MPPRTRRRGARPPEVINAAADPKKAFLTAVKTNNIDRVRELIGTIDVNMVDESEGKFTPLMIAAFKGHIEIAKMLIESGADINIRNVLGNTALLLAASYNRIELVKILLAAGANLNITDINGNTALIVALNSNRTEIAKILVAAGADVNIINDVGETALILAAAYGHNPTIKMLIDAGADVNIRDDNGNTALIIATREGHTGAVKTLIDAEADVDITYRRGETALIIAIVYGYINIIKHLINAGANLNIQNEDGNTALLVSIEDMRNMKAAKILIDAGADVNIANKHGITALINIIYPWIDIPIDTRTQMIKLLLDKGADVNKQNSLGDTALSIAARDDYTDIVKLLLARNPSLTDTIKGNIKQKKYQSDILKLLVNHYSAELITATIPWKGQSRGNIEKFDTLFANEESMRNWSFCPICLGWIPRADGCMYMTHNCSRMPYYHSELYEKYKNREGLISWCTICGRICAGHYHYPIVDAKATKPQPLISERSDPFETDCRISNGGGGLPEKIARIRQLRETAHELQTEVGKMKHEEAMNTLVEDSWNAAKLTGTFKLKRIEATKTWNIPVTNFPANTVTNGVVNIIANANDPTKYSQPTVLSPGFGAAAEGRNEGYEYNSVSYADDIPLIVFKHKDKDGNERIHPQIGKDSLLADLMTSEKRGKCFDTDCGGLLYPREIEMAFTDPKLAPTVTEEDRKTLVKYKEWFNKWRAEDAKHGGRRTRRHLRAKRRHTRRYTRK